MAGGVSVENYNSFVNNELGILMMSAVRSSKNNSCQTKAPKVATCNTGDNSGRSPG
jgi:hypothetical protein